VRRKELDKLDVLNGLDSEEKNALDGDEIATPLTGLAMGIILTEWS